jgi:hypothetical protein
MSKDKLPSPRVGISARDLRDIILDELYGAQNMLHCENARKAFPNEMIKEIAKTIVALLSP